MIRIHDMSRKKGIAAALFCQRDGPDTSNLRNILPSLVANLTKMFTPFLTSCCRPSTHTWHQSQWYSLILNLIHSVPPHPKCALVFVIDAFDRCGNSQGCPGILGILTDAAVLAPWLKVIITSQPKVNTQGFFNVHQLSHSQYDLTTDIDAACDVQVFSQCWFGWVASKWHLPSFWPEKSLHQRNTCWGSLSGSVCWVVYHWYKASHSNLPSKLAGGEVAWPFAGPHSPSTQENPQI